MNFAKLTIVAATTISLTASLVMPLSLSMAQGENSTELPVRRIVLFNVGVGFFEHAGQASGDATVSLPFASEEMDDLLKTLVMQGCQRRPRVGRLRRSGQLRPRRH